MSITDELREWGERQLPHLPYRKALAAIADRIDAAHEDALISSYFDGVFSDEELAENGFIRLPKDADGEYIRVGDVMEGEKFGGGFSEPFEVVGYIMSNGELEPMDENKCPRKRKYSHHHHAPTVEDVLLELEGMRGNNADYEEVVTRCAELAKTLRELLADDAE